MLKEPFDRLAGGYDPLSGADLTQERKQNRRAANDITISAPKDFSLIYLAEKDERGSGSGCCRRSWKAATGSWAKWRRTPLSRVRIGGADADRKTGNWAYAGFLQFDSRPDEKTELPTIQIHRHHTVFNLTRDPVEQRFKALQLGLVKGNADFWMPLFHNELARRVRALGYGIRRKKETGIVGFAIAGVPRALVMRNSPRRLTILEAKERIAKKEGITDPERLRRLQAELAVLTRRHKQKDLSREELWSFLERGLSPQDPAVLDKAKGQRGWVTTDAEAMRHAVEHLSYWQNVVPEKKLLSRSVRYGVGSVTLDGLKREMKGQGVLVENGQATTVQLKQQEGFITGFVRDGKGKKRPVVAAPVDVRQLIGASAARETIRLTDEQASAIGACVGSRDVVNVVDAGQGTGKTTMLEQYGKILARNKVRSTWLGTTHTAVDELKARGLSRHTLAYFLASKDAQRRRPVRSIILDEASMLAHRDAYQLCMYAKEQDCRIDFIGDSKQYKSPIAGNAMGLLTDVRYGGVVPITMTKTMPQAG